MTPEMREKLIERSGAKGRSITQEIELLLEQALFMEWLRVGCSAPGLWYDIVGQGDASGLQRAKELGVEGDWPVVAEPLRASMRAVVRRMLQMLAEFDLEAESGDVVKTMLVDVMLSEHRRRRQLRGEIVELPAADEEKP